VQERVREGLERGKRAGGVDKSGADGVVVPDAAEHDGEDERRDDVARVSVGRASKTAGTKAGSSSASSARDGLELGRRMASTSPSPPHLTELPSASVLLRS
jgi:hypothetical protein